MGFKDLLILGLTHPGDLRVLAQYWLYDERRDITLPSEYETTRYDQKTMRRCWELLDLTSRSFSAVIKELDGELARVVRAFELFAVRGPCYLGMGRSAGTLLALMVFGDCGTEL